MSGNTRKNQVTRLVTVRHRSTMSGVLRTCQPLIAARSVRYRSLRGSFAASQPGQQLTPEPNIVGAAEDVRAVSRECRDDRGGRRHRYTATVWFYGLWTPGPVPLSRLIAIAVTRRRIEEDHQLAEQSTGLDAGQVIRWMSWHRWTAICLLAHIYLAVAVAVLRQHEAGSDPDAGADPSHRPGAVAALVRHRDPAAPARPGPPAALVGLAAPAPAPRPPSPPTLERLRRDNTMITMNYSRRIGAER
jgi:hypothetical protein